LEQNAENKKQVFMQLYAPCHKQLNAYCIALAKDREDALDLMSATIEIAFTKFSELKEAQKFKYFLFGIASRLINNERRKASAKIFVVTDYLLNIKDNNHHADAGIDTYYLQKALQKLNTDMREAIVLFELQGFSIKEIADIQNTNENTIKTRLLRGREKLKALLNPETTKENTNLKYGTR
jgi:RNA polymerase sigma-70 factor (ECF subfamily)